MYAERVMGALVRGEDTPFARGCGLASAGACSGESGTLPARDALDPDRDGDGKRGEGGGLTNIDFVPSTKRPPRGGPSTSGGLNEVCCGAGEDGPAPGD